MTRSLNEDLKQCNLCEELRDFNFLPLCKACRFRENLAVKASRKIIRSAKRHGNPVVKVDDGGDIITGSERDLLEAVHSVDFSTLYLQDGQFVSVVGGNESETDTIANHSGSIEDIITDAKLSDHCIY